MLLAALGAALSARRRGSAPRRPFELSAGRARALVALPLMAIGLSWSGCSCSDDEEAGGKPSEDAGTDTGKPPGSCPEAENCSELQPGLVGAYASAVVDGDTIWVAGYEDMGYEISPDGTETVHLWGDLVVGRYDGTKVEWQVVDGMPADAEQPDPFEYDITGFRYGITDPGDDVGLWTSIAVEGGAVRVAYYDAKNRALKFAAQNGDQWAIHTVEQVTNADVGRYAKLKYVGGQPVIAYMVIRPGADGAAESALRVATGTTSAPAAAGEWTIVDAVVDSETPCRAFICPSDECRADTLACAPTTTGCDPKCETGSKCFDEGGTPTCREVLDNSHLDTYPPGIGLYPTLLDTPNGLGIVYYDRPHGNLMAVRQDGGSWGAPIILDGQGNGPNGPVDTGDVGIGASAFVDGAGDWHVAYANGFDESLRYIKIAGGFTPGASEIVDDGVTPDGNVVVGDDTSIRVTAGGEVQIAYQNATTGEARFATGTPNGASYSWTTKVLSVSDFAGGFNQILEVGGQTRVLTWWRRGKPRTEGDIAIVSP